jgi:hypothetical protein
MDICLRLFCALVVALRRADPPSKESYRLCRDYGTEKSSAKTHKRCTATEEEEEEFEESGRGVSSSYPGIF